MKSTQTRQVWNWSPLRPSGDGLKGKPATTIEAATRDLEDGLGIPYAQLKIISPDECKVREKGVSFLGRDIPKAMTRLEHWVPGRFKTGASVEGVARLRVNFIPCPREGRVELVLNIVGGPTPPDEPAFIHSTGSVEVTRRDGKLCQPWKVESMFRFALAQAEAGLYEIMARRLRREAELVWKNRETY